MKQLVDIVIQMLRLKILNPIPINRIKEYPIIK